MHKYVGLVYSGHTTNDAAERVWAFRRYSAVPQLRCCAVGQRCCAVSQICVPSVGDVFRRSDMCAVGKRCVSSVRNVCRRSDTYVYRRSEILCRRVRDVVPSVTYVCRWSERVCRRSDMYVYRRSEMCAGGQICVPSIRYMLVETRYIPLSPQAFALRATMYTTLPTCLWCKLGLGV